jgi:hypothetical protein
MKSEFVMFDNGDYLLRVNSELIGSIHKLIKGGWIGKSHIKYGEEVTAPTRKEAAEKLMLIKENL